MQQKRLSLPIESKNILDNKEDIVFNKIKVYCRFKPLKVNLNKCYQINKELGIIEVKNNKIKNSNVSQNKKFIFSEIFDENVKQEEVFDNIGLNLIYEIFEKNHDSLIFSYGVTNAGKTYTILGNKNEKGILFRLLYKLLEMKKYFNNNDDYELCIDGNKKYISKYSFLYFNDFSDDFKFDNLDIKIESFQIYNEEIFDLFVSKNELKQQNKLKVREYNKKIIIEDLNEKNIENIDDIKNYIFKTERNKKVCSTGSNFNSSRSHTIYKIKLEFKYKNEIESLMFDKNIIVIDLAGSERVKKTFNSSNKLIEANNINKSLLVLGKCLKSMSNKQNIPFRESKLTRILSEFFNGHHLIRMIVNINPDPKDFEETLRVLEYSSIAREVKIITQKLQKKKPKIILKTPIKSMKFLEKSLGTTIKNTKNSENLGTTIKNTKNSENLGITIKNTKNSENLEESKQKENNFNDILNKINNKLDILIENHIPINKDLYYFSDLTTKEQIKIIKNRKINYYN